MPVAADLREPGGEGSIAPSGEPYRDWPVAPGETNFARMVNVLLASDAPWVVADVSGTLLSPEFELRIVDRGDQVLGAALELPPQLVILDLQIGNMGAAAIAAEVRNEIDAGNLDPTPLLFLLDRAADEWLARRLGADAWLLKPVGPGMLVTEARTLTHLTGLDGKPTRGRATSG